MAKKRKSKPKNYGDDIIDVVTTGAKVGIVVGATGAILGAINKK